MSEIEYKGFKITIEQEIRYTVHASNEDTVKGDQIDEGFEASNFEDPADAEEYIKEEIDKGYNDDGTDK